MNLDMLQAYIKGYGDKLLDYQLIALQSGYWSAYYSGSKHPKPLQKISEDIIEKHYKQGATKISSPKPDVDVEAFLAVEAQFQAKLNQKVGGM